MVHSLSRYSRLLPLVALAALSACGGGGGDSAAVTDGIDRYVGTWKACAAYSSSDGTAIYTKETIVLNKINGTSANYTSTWLNMYEDASCAKVKSAFYAQYASVYALVKPFSLGNLSGHQITDTYPSGKVRTEYIAVDDTGKTLYYGAGNVQSSPPTGWSTPYTKQ